MGKKMSSYIGVKILILFLVLPLNVVGQAPGTGRQDSLSLQVFAGVQASSRSDILPHYLVHNQYGEVNENDRAFIGGRLRYEKGLTQGLDFTTGFSFRNDVLSSHFVSLLYKGIFLKAGRVKETTGGLDNNLASGSLALSQNALPAPMVAVGFTDYKSVPYLQGYFEVKGSLSHRWLESDRYISNALLHGKTFYARLNLDKLIGFKASSGVVHFAQYGGVSPQGDKQPSGFSDYLRVFSGAGIPNPNGTTEGESNGLGNHIGIVETIVEQRVGAHLLKINYQKPFEDEGSIQYVSLTDYLFGMEWTLPNKDGWLTQLYVEWMQTKWQGGPGLPDATEEIPDVDSNFGYNFGQRDDIYNNWLYRSGWTYQGQVLGNPLFLTHQRTLNFLDPYPDYETSIANNRIRSLHVGVTGNIASGLTYRGLFTYSENYGTYAGLYEGRFSWNGIASDPDFEYPFRPGKIQKYAMIEVSYDRLFETTPIRVKLQIARDYGELYSASGLSFSVHYELTKH
jgi:hypothetical protein